MSTPPEQEAGVDPLDAAVVIDPDNPAVYGHGEDVPGYASRYFDTTEGEWTIRTPYTVCFFEKLAPEIKQKIIDEMTPIIEAERLPIREYYKDFRVQLTFNTFKTMLGKRLDNLHEIIIYYATHQLSREFSGWREEHDEKFMNPEPRDFYELRQKWNNEKKFLVDEFLQQMLGLYDEGPCDSGELIEMFEEELQPIDESLKKLHQAIEKSITRELSFYEHQREWQTKNRLWMILGNRVEKQAARDRIMLSRNPPPSPSPSPSPEPASASADPPSRNNSPGYYVPARTISYGPDSPFDPERTLSYNSEGTISSYNSQGTIPY